PLSMSPAARRVLTAGEQNLARRYQIWLAVNHPDYGQTLFSQSVRNEFSDQSSLLADWQNKLVGLETKKPFHQMLWLETQTRMVDFINFEVDKMSMASSIEARVPFLDHKLWEFCATLPAHYKLKGNLEKHLLRQATKNILPEKTRTRRKKGLAAPYAGWLKSKTLPDWAETALSPNSLKQAGIFQPKAVQTLRQAHQAGQPGLGSLLMGVLSTQVWFDQFINNR
ncbi:MAG: asparagine synthase C-terminal domain-containing protein, partial [Chloroflexota bacterium]